MVWSLDHLVVDLNCSNLEVSYKPPSFRDMGRNDDELELVLPYCGDAPSRHDYTLSIPFSFRHVVMGAWPSGMTRLTVEGKVIPYGPPRPLRGLVDVDDYWVMEEPTAEGEGVVVELCSVDQGHLVGVRSLISFTL